VVREEEWADAQEGKAEAEALVAWRAGPQAEPWVEAAVAVTVKGAMRGEEMVVVMEVLLEEEETGAEAEEGVSVAWKEGEAMAAGVMEVGALEEVTVVEARVGVAMEAAQAVEMVVQQVAMRVAKVLDLSLTFVGRSHRERQGRGICLRGR